MSRLRLRISMSLDGYVAGPDQSVDHPLGVGGERLHQWLMPLAAWRAASGMTGGETNESNVVVEESMAGIGATIMGRNMFGGHPGPWDPARPWTGWWGTDPPFHHPVFVLTHHAREPLALEGGTTFTFVTGGIESALAQALRAAGGKDVSLAGGASVAAQYLAAGLVDEMETNLVPTLLGGGARLFDGVSDLHGLELVRTVATSAVVHVKLARRGMMRDLARDETLLRETYAAFNARDVERALLALHPDVDWPNGMEGGRVIGREAVRAYWLRQWTQIDPQVEPRRFTAEGEERVVVDVHQVVRDRAGAVLSDGMVQHVYELRSGVVRRMDIRTWPGEGGRQ